MTPFRVLSVAAATGRVGYIYFEGGPPVDWALSQKASRSPQDAAAMARRWIAMLTPDVLITEKVGRHSRKGDTTRALIDAIAREAAGHELHDIAVPRQQHHANKYAEAATYAERFPELRPLLPAKRRIWDKEPPNITYFEAIALALPVLDTPQE